MLGVVRALPQMDFVMAAIQTELNVLRNRSLARHLAASQLLGRTAKIVIAVLTRVGQLWEKDSSTR